MRGRFITFEGGDGCGKTTQSARLREWLEHQGIPAICTREPGGSPGAEYIRGLLLNAEDADWDPISEVLLFTIARRDHVRKTIQPALDAGTWVICDRFFDSTLAYQAYGNGLGREFPELCYRSAIGNLQPDLTVLLDIPEAEGLKRAATVSGNRPDRFEARDIAFHTRLREGFLAIARQEPERVLCLDAGRDLEVIARDIQAQIAARFGLKS